MDLNTDVSLLIDRAEKQRKDIISQLHKLRNQSNASKEAQQRQSEIIKEKVARLSKEIEELPLFVEDVIAPEATLRALRIRVSKLTEDYKSLRTQVRKAILESKKAVENITKKERDELFEGHTNRNLTAESNVLNTSASLTTALHRTTAILRTNLSQSSAHIEALSHSSHTLKSTTEQYSSMDDLLTSSRKLIRRLQRADVWDRVVIIAALMWFLLVVGYIVKKRTFDKGVRLVGWAMGKSKKGKTKILASPIPVEILDAVSSVFENVETSVDTFLDTASEYLAAATSSLATSPSPILEHAEL